jgi:acetoin utilization deacetylase AcuC-like enzyme
MRVVYSPRYHIDIGTHVFPTQKYVRLYDRIKSSHPGTLVVEPAPASWDDLALVHTPEYLHKIQTGRFELDELAQLEVPWSPEIVEGFRLMTGGTIAAAREAVSEKRGQTPFSGESSKPGSVPSFHIGGGFHHAFANHGEGFCLFNDVAVALRALFNEGSIERGAVVDLDVHHGNGTALLFERDPRVFTFSMHQQHNYPAYKPRGSLDVGLSDGAGDEEYLSLLQPALDAVFRHEPGVVFYLAGADPFEDDLLGGLRLTRAGLRERDRLVLQASSARHVPVVVLLAGGYARNIDDTVSIHYATFQEANRIRQQPEAER